MVSKIVDVSGKVVVVTGASILLPFMSSFVLVAGSQVAAGAAESVFGPAVAAITLGLMGSWAFARRIGRNESFRQRGLEGGTNRRLYISWLAWLYCRS